MEGLLSFLIFGGIFYLMMRYGCGAHMFHDGLRGHGSNRSAKNITDIDPVCGMQVDVHDGYGRMYEGKLYRFCTRKCLDRFEQDPDSYITMPVRKAGGKL